MELIRGAAYDLAIFDEAMKETKHDMTAFLWAMYPSVGERGEVSAPGFDYI